MSKELTPQYNPKEVEDKIYRIWEKSGYFAPEAHQPRADNPNSKKTFSIALPPPNITGSLHMGHALNATIQDILIRKKRMEGYKTLWLPGTDHAGIATQYVVEKELKKEGISKHDLGKEKFLERVWEWREKYGHIILEQFKKIGASMDWSRTRFTMDTDYKKAVEAAFLYYHRKGLIYQGERAVNWCSRCGTSLSDLELEHREEKTKFYYIKYGPLKVGTVRPETKLGDTALAVNPKDVRYKSFIGKEITIRSVNSSIPREKSPQLKNIKIKVIADIAADPQFGTGVIKVTPAHDQIDYEIYSRHPEIPILRVIDERGRMTKAAGIRYEGLKVMETREQIIKDLETLGLIDHIEDYTHNVATCYRCGTIIEPLLSKQWFLKMDHLAKISIAAVKSGIVSFRPKRWEKVYFDWLKNIRDWPISRQLWWGQKIPLEGVDDVLDTWFSSALWPLAALGWPIACAQNQKSPPEADPPSAEKTSAKSRSAFGGKNQKYCIPKKGSDLDLYYPTAVLSTARDIINLWVARMVFSGMEFTGREPFKNVIIHATILTKDGRRMSKSLGTGVDPMDLISRYGADATRFGLIWQAMGNQDIHWSEEHIVAGKKFCNKLWNASRFVLQQIGKSEILNPKYETNTKFKTRNHKHLTAVDKKIITALAKTKKEVGARIEKYEFGQALHVLYDFFWHEFCDKYLEVSKSEIRNPKSEKTTKETLLYVLSESLKLLHPFMPFITEELWKYLPLKNKKLLIIEHWPK